MKSQDLPQEISKMLSARPAEVDKGDRLWETAVLLPLVRSADGSWNILFEERSSRLSWQPGDICFPGGRREATDATLAATALRETCEELGLRPESISLCGELDYLVTHMGPIVHPFVGVLEDAEHIRYNEDEVGSVFTVPLQALLEQKPREAVMELQNRAPDDFPFDLLPRQPREWRKRKGYKVYFYTYEGHVIWGITARILHGFLERIIRNYRI